MSLNFKIIKIPQPFFLPTNVIRIGDSILDTGHMSDMSTSVLREQLEKGELRGVNEVIVTHPHVDHVGGSEASYEIAEKPHVVFEDGESIVRHFSEYLLEVQEEQSKLLPFKNEETTYEFLKTYFSTDRDYQKVNVSEIVGEGDKIEVGNIVLKAIHTPGHEANHMALYHGLSGILFTGDLVMNNALFMYAPLTSSVTDYEKSLKKLLELKPRLIVPSHGNPIEDPVKHVNKCLENSQRIKSEIMSKLEKREKATHFQLAKSIFRITGTIKVGFSALMILAYLKHLEENGEVVVDVDKGVIASKRFHR